MFRYLVVGLIDEQVRVAQVVPGSVGEQDLNPFGDQIAWKDSRWSRVRRWRLPRLVDSMAEIGVDLIHALDGRLWDGAVRLAQRLNRPVVLSSASALDVKQVGRIVSRLEPSKVAFAACTQPLGEDIRRLTPEAVTVRVVRPGVHVPDDAPQSARRDGVLCGVISATSRYDADYESLFEALRRVIEDDPSAQFFLDSLGHERHSLWQAARGYGLLANLSLVPRRIGHRELLMGADMLIHPQTLGRARGLTLQAMAYGMPVLARTDQWLDYLVHDQTAWLIESPDPQSWYDLIRRVAHDSAATRRLGEQARQWVRQRHLAANQVAGTLELYRIVSGESLKFPGRD